MRNTYAFKLNEIFLYTLLLGIISGLTHSIYEFTGNNLLIGLFNPVNESVWEHLKLMFFAPLIFWIVMYKIKSKKYEIKLYIWIVSATVYLIVAPLAVILFFYGYTGALGIESILIDVFLTFICHFIALSIASHVLKYSNPSKSIAIICIIIVSTISTMFVVFTNNPPGLPIFYDNSTTM